MNQMQSYSDVHHPHMSAPQHGQVSGPTSGLSHYSHYQQPQILQPSPSSYPSQANYAPNGYSYGVQQSPGSGHPVTSSMGSQLVSNSQTLPAMSLAPTSSSLSGGQEFSGRAFDTSGQVAPPGMKPRVTATLWEDEGSLCFQVEAKGVCVARREDNHMINGTKLLNVAGMTRGRRDGILKSEKTRHVVKIGPMHLKGVWIPFDRALDFANKEKITEQLYPLFVHDIAALLYHPSNQRPGVGGAATAALDRRRVDQQHRYLPGTTQAPPLTHHHTMSNPVGAAHMPQQSHAIAPHPNSGRPGLDRAHTFPTPPTSASSVMGMGNQGSSYEWSGQNVQGMQNSQPLSIDTGLSNTRSVPTTPASTPPGAMQNMPQYQTSQGYDSSRQMYSAPAVQQGQYGGPQGGMVRPGMPPQSAGYPKSEMAPPARVGGEADHEGEAKAADYHGGSAHVIGEVEAEHEHDNEYTHASGPYNATRPPYAYNPNAAAGGLQGDANHSSPEMTSSPAHHNGSGRATPRTTTQGQWNSGYNTPQRSNTAPSSNVYNVMSDPSGHAPNGNSDPRAYAQPMQAGYPSQYQPVNGVQASNKRGRDDDDEQDPYGRPSSRDAVDGLKRRKTIRGDSVGGPVGAPAFAPPHQQSPRAIQQRR